MGPARRAPSKKRNDADLDRETTEVGASACVVLTWVVVMVVVVVWGNVMVEVLCA